MSGDTGPEPNESVLAVAYGRVLTLVRAKFRVPTADAEDIASDALERALKNMPPTLDQPVVAWLSAVATRIAIDRFRERERHAKLAKAIPPPSPGFAAPDAVIGDEQTAAARQRVIDALEPDDRRFFDIWVRQHAEEISRQTAISVLKCSMAEYQARKKRVGLKLEKIVGRLGLSIDDLWSDGETNNEAGATDAAAENEETR